MMLLVGQRQGHASFFQYQWRSCNIESSAAELYVRCIKFRRSDKEKNIFTGFTERGFSCYGLQFIVLL